MKRLTYQERSNLACVGLLLLKTRSLLQTPVELLLDRENGSLNRPLPRQIREEAQTVYRVCCQGMERKAFVARA